MHHDQSPQDLTRTLHGLTDIWNVRSVPGLVFSLSLFEGLAVCSHAYSLSSIPLFRMRAAAIDCLMIILTAL